MFSDIKTEQAVAIFFEGREKDMDPIEGLWRKPGEYKDSFTFEAVIVKADVVRKKFKDPVLDDYKGFDYFFIYTSRFQRGQLVGLYKTEYPY